MDSHHTFTEFIMVHACIITPTVVFTELHHLGLLIDLP